MSIRVLGLAAVLTALIASPLHGQRGATLGLRGGVTVAGASFDADETLAEGNRTGFVGGVFVDWDPGALGFQIGAQYAQKGVELDFGTVVRDFDFAYLEIPAVAKLGFPLGPLDPSVFAGAALSFVTSCEFDGDDCSDDIEGTEVAGVAGADVALHLGALSLWVDGRYHFGLSDVTDADDVVGDLKHRNWALQAGVGFRPGG